MEPIKFEEANSTLLGGDPVVKDLPVYSEGDKPYIVSCWKLSYKDRVRSLFGKPIWLHVRGYTHPPLKLSTENPWKQ